MRKFQAQGDESAVAQAREQELSAIYEHIPGILFYVSIEPDGNFRFQSMSQAGLAAMGLTREQVVGAFVHDVIPLSSRDLVLKNYRHAIQSGQTVRWREVSIYPAGRKVGEVAVTPLCDKRGIATHLIGIVHDVTEREQLEEFLLKQRDEVHHHELKLLLETAAQGIVSIDASGQILTMNRALETMFGWAEGELIGKSIELLVPSSLRAGHEQYRMNYFASPRPRLMGGGLSLVGQRKDGTTFPIEVSLNHVGTPCGGHAFAFISDITERTQLEAARSEMSRIMFKAQEQERARIGRELHDNVSQRVAMLAVELQQLEDDPSNVTSQLRELRKQVIELSNDVQALSHELHSSKLEYMGANAGIKSWCKEFAQHSNVEVDFRDKLQSAVPYEMGVSLLRVLQEALHNAIKHSGVKRIEVQLLESAGEIQLIIRDSGKGFDVETAMQGKGLGLTSMRERVRLFNGTIAIDSKPMRGTTINVRLPLGSERDFQREAR